MLPEEQAGVHRYFYEYASGRFGYRPELLEGSLQAFHIQVRPSGEDRKPEFYLPRSNE